MAQIFERGIYAILDFDHLSPVLPAAPGDERNLWLAYASAAVDNGATALQLRAKSVPTSSLYLRRLYQELLKEYGARIPIVLNDHIDQAAHFRDAAGCGVHLGQDDQSPFRARAVLGADALVGLSTHTLAQVEASGQSQADYIGFGPILSTQSKSDPEPELGMEALAQACDRRAKPVVAIGGLGIDHVEAVRRSGAQAMATISGWLGPKGQPWSPGQAGMTMSMMTAIWKVTPGKKL